MHQNVNTIPYRVYHSPSEGNNNYITFTYIYYIYMNVYIIINLIKFNLIRLCLISNSYC